MNCLARDDPRYPAGLHDLRAAPDHLWIDGDLAVLDGPAVAIVGTRRMTPYGERVARELATAMALAGAVVVSGLAPGIDCAAHLSALAAGGSSIAVLGEGITSFLANAGGRRRRLAQTLRGHGALSSTYPPLMPAQGWMFAKRNAVIAALARAVIVVEAPAGSGALITAAEAIRLRRPLFAVPGPIGAHASEGTNALIAAGTARACLGAEAVGQAIGVSAPPNGSREDEVLEALAAGPLGLDELATRLPVDRVRLRARLAALLMEGAVTDNGDGRYARR